MKKIVLILLLFVSSVGADVDLVVKANDYWKKGLNFTNTPTENAIDTTGWTVDSFKVFFKRYWQQNHRGDIIDVFPVAESHGTQCCFPPAFVTITVTGVTVEKAKEYLGQLEDTLAAPSDTAFSKFRRFHFKQAVVDSALVLWDLNGGKLVLSKQTIRNQDLLIEYDLAAIKQKIIDRLKQ
jgi:hypothetical protein